MMFLGFGQPNLAFLCWLLLRKAYLRALADRPPHRHEDYLHK
jgi:hypothetical protein